MSDPKKPHLDEAAHGGGIGTVDRQPVDPSTQNRGEADPNIAPAGEGPEAGLSVEPDSRPSDEDPDASADETLGETP